MAIIFFAVTFSLIYFSYHQSSTLDKLEAESETEIVTGIKENNIYLLEAISGMNERYKIVNIVYSNSIVYAIVHLDNGNIKVIPIEEAWIDPELKNVNEGYLYRENNQIYIRAK